jgi:hypothetical protein
VRLTLKELSMRFGRWFLATAVASYVGLSASTDVSAAKPVPNPRVQVTIDDHLDGVASDDPLTSGVGDLALLDQQKRANSFTGLGSYHMPLSLTVTCVANCQFLTLPPQ